MSHSKTTDESFQAIDYTSTLNWKT